MNAVFNRGSEKVEVSCGTGTSPTGRGDVSRVEKGGVGIAELLEGFNEVVFVGEGEGLKG